MEERLEAPSVVSNPLPASADPHGISAVYTRHLSMPDRVTRHAFPVTFERDACSPFRSGTGCWPGTSAARASRLATRGSAAPRGPSVVEMGWPALRVSGSSSLRRAGPPSYGLPCGRTRSTSSMDSTDFCFPTVFDYEHSRHMRSQHLFEACASPLRPGLAPRMTETGGPGGSRRPIRFSGRSRIHARRFLPRASDTTVPLTSLSRARGSCSASAMPESPGLPRPCFAGDP